MLVRREDAQKSTQAVEIRTNPADVKIQSIEFSGKKVNAWWVRELHV
jgi:hypothetical protein